jgi:hypothetical protein
MRVSMGDTTAGGLAPAQIEQFITDGFVRIDRAFPREQAAAARAILWKATGDGDSNSQDKLGQTAPGMVRHVAFGPE